MKQEDKVLKKQNIILLKYINVPISQTMNKSHDLIVKLCIAEEKELKEKNIF